MSKQCLECSPMQDGRPKLSGSNRGKTPFRPHPRRPAADPRSDHTPSATQAPYAHNPLVCLERPLRTVTSRISQLPPPRGASCSPPSLHVILHRRRNRVYKTLGAIRLAPETRAGLADKYTLCLIRTSCQATHLTLPWEFHFAPLPISFQIYGERVKQKHVLLNTRYTYRIGCSLEVDLPSELFAAAAVLCN